MAAPPAELVIHRIDLSPIQMSSKGCFRLEASAFHGLRETARIIAILPLESEETARSSGALHENAKQLPTTSASAEAKIDTS
jgi:hypothetical protein